MAMLAEPRRRQKYSTDPRGLTWATDGDKFGQKMLEKMGWEKGKGLGANEDGRKDHVKVDMKFNTRGVGCSKTHADNWIAHQDDFNSLLSQLNTDHGDSNTQETDSNSRVMSLEAKSKTSKSRVHYQKFTKGKDLSSRKVDDLACIFGKRKSKSEGNTPLQSEVNSDAEENKTDLDRKGQKVDDSHGVKTVTSSTSIADYFAEKMAQLKKSRAAQNRSSHSEHLTPFSAGPSPRDSESPDQSDEGISFSAKVDHTDFEASVQNDLTEKKKKKKKEKKKSKQKSQLPPSASPDQSEDDVGISFTAKLDESNVTGIVVEIDPRTEMKKKKKKKSKRKLQDSTDLEEASCEKKQKCKGNGSDEEDCKDKIKKKKKKSKKSKKESMAPESPVGDNKEVADTDVVEEKERPSQTTECDVSESSTSDKKNQESSKKKKKRKDKELPKDCKSAEVKSTEHSETRNKRKKLPSEVTQQIWSQAENAGSPAKKRKRNKNKNKEIVIDEDNLGFKGANLEQIKGYP